MVEGGFISYCCSSSPIPMGNLGQFLAKGEKCSLPFLQASLPGQLMNIEQPQSLSKREQAGLTQISPPKNRNARRIDGSRGACKGASFLGPGQGSLALFFHTCRLQLPWKSMASFHSSCILMIVKASFLYFPQSILSSRKPFKNRT